MGIYFSWQCTGWGAVQCTEWGPTFLGSVLGGGQYSVLSGDLLFLAVYWLGAVQCTEWGPTFLGSVLGGGSTVY